MLKTLFPLKWIFRWINVCINGHC